MAKQDSKHLPQLDGLRGVAIAMVLALHTIGGNVPVLGHLFRFGWAGVDLFFVLSGFLITGILIKEKEQPNYFRNFYARRALRIWPLYCLVVTLAFCFGTDINSQLHFDPSMDKWQYYATFTQNIFRPNSFGPWPLSVTWSLAIEEQYYVVWPVLVWMLPIRHLKPLLLFVVAMSPVARFWCLTTGTTPLSLYIATPLRIDGLAVGGLIALMGTAPLREHIAVVKAFCFAGISSAFAISFALLGGERLVIGTDVVRWPLGLALAGIYSLLALGFGGLVALALISENVVLSRVLGLSALRFIGNISFGIYLLHGVILILDHILLRPRYAAWLGLDGRPLVGFSVILEYVFIFSAACASWYLLERPLLRLKKRFRPSASATPRTAGEP